jgi:hypothetical protein
MFIIYSLSDQILGILEAAQMLWQKVFFCKSYLKQVYCQNLLHYWNQARQRWRDIINTNLDSLIPPITAMMNKSTADELPRNCGISPDYWKATTCKPASSHSLSPTIALTQTLHAAENIVGKATCFIADSCKHTHSCIYIDGGNVLVLSWNNVLLIMMVF